MPSPTPAQLAASLVGSESDNVEVVRLVREAIAARTTLVFELVSAPSSTESGYLEALDKLVTQGSADPLIETIAIEQMIRARTYTSAHWLDLLHRLLRLAAAARTAYADAILTQLGPP